MTVTSPAKRVLMICYYYPPILASGTARSSSFSKLLQEFGWDVTVLTVNEAKDPYVRTGTEAPAPGVRVVRTDERNLSRVVDFLHGAISKFFGFFRIDLKTNYFRELFCIPDTQITWSSTKMARALAKECDCIYVSCSPFSSIIPGVRAKKATDKPLIIDFRDAWSMNPHIQHTRFHRMMVKWYERWMLHHADKLILNTRGAEKVYRETYPEFAEKFTSIPNGYDELTPVTVKNRERFVIMHVGNFYGERSPELLLEALSEIANDDIEFVQVGGSILGGERFEGKVKMRAAGKVSRNEAIRLMQEASLLYLKQGWEKGVSNYIAVAAKTYEYLATGLPILAEVPPGDNADIVREYCEHAFVVTTQSKDHLKRAILAAYANRALFKPHISEKFTQQFSRQQLTLQLATLMEVLVKR